MSQDHRPDEMGHQPLVSVIIIFLNAEPFIREAIESVFAQRWVHWELLLVDDGSTDGSTAIAQEYTERYPHRVRYLEHPGHINCGMSASRNLGIQQATGEYIAFLDADDIWLPQKLEQQCEILAAQPAAAMVYGPTEWWYSWSGKPEDQGRDFVHGLGVPANTLIQPPTLVTRFLLNESLSPCTCSMLVRRSILEQVGGFENVFRGLYEDQAFCAKVCLTAPIFASSECWYRYRQHPASSCAVAQRTGQAKMARGFFLHWLASYLTEQQITDVAVWQALRRALRPYRYPFVYRLIAQVQGIAQQVRRLPTWILQHKILQYKEDATITDAESRTTGNLR